MSTLQGDSEVPERAHIRVSNACDLCVTHNVNVHMTHTRKVRRLGHVCVRAQGF